MARGFQTAVLKGPSSSKATNQQHQQVEKVRPKRCIAIYCNPLLNCVAFSLFCTWIIKRRNSTVGWGEMFLSEKVGGRTKDFGAWLRKQPHKSSSLEIPIQGQKGTLLLVFSATQLWTPSDWNYLSNPPRSCVWMSLFSLICLLPPPPPPSTPPGV